jgi:hypothetical protein
MKNNKPLPEPEFEQYMVLVLGMHRSGTSTFTGVMNYLGCTLPEDLMPPTEANPKGYFESVAVSKFNDQLLETAGASWRDWHPINDSWFASPVGKAFLPEARDLLTTEFKNAPLTIFKDPRVCRMVPFWLQATSMAGYKALPVLIHRNPLEVGASLQKRDGIPLVEGYLIWLRHILDAERATRGQLRFITSYDRILTDWEGEISRLQKELDIFLPRSDRRAAAAIDDFISPGLRHFTASEEKLTRDKTLPAWVRDTYRIFERWAAKGEVKADYKTLDAIGAQVDEITPTLADMVDTSKKQVISLKASLAGHKSKYDVQFATYENETSRLKKELETAQEDMAAQRAQTAEREAELERLRDQLDARAQEHEAALASQSETYEIETLRLKKELETAQEDMAAQRAQTAERETELERLRDQLSQSESALAQRKEEAEQAWKRAENAEAEMEKKTAENQELAAQNKIKVNELSLMARLLKQNEELLSAQQASGQENIDRLESQLADLQSRSEQERAEAQAKLIHLAETETAVEKLSVKQQTHTSELSQMARLFNESEEKFHQQQLETDSLRTQVAAQIGETKRLQTETAAQQAHIKFVESELAAIRASRFWRATGPLRRFLDAMRGKV